MTIDQCGHSERSGHSDHTGHADHTGHCCDSAADADPSSLGCGDAELQADPCWAHHVKQVVREQYMKRIFAEQEKKWVLSKSGVVTAPTVKQNSEDLDENESNYENGSVSISRPSGVESRYGCFLIVSCEHQTSGLTDAVKGIDFSRGPVQLIRISLKPCSENNCVADESSKFLPPVIRSMSQLLRGEAHLIVLRKADDAAVVVKRDSIATSFKGILGMKGEKELVPGDSVERSVIVENVCAFLRKTSGWEPVLAESLIKVDENR